MPLSDFFCPRCGSDQIVKNGNTYAGKQNYRCKACGRQFTDNPATATVEVETWTIVDKLLQENLSLEAIARIVEIPLGLLKYHVKTRNGK